VFEDSKGVIRIRKSSKNRQHNGQKKKDKQRSTRHTCTHKTKDHWAHFYGHYLFLHEDKYYMRNKNNKITQKTTIKTEAC
jgi:hypothetical protein